MIVKRTWPIYAVLLPALVLSAAAGCYVGATSLSMSDLFAPGIGQLRLARVLLTMVVGAGLSVAGVIFQALLRNPLAEPYILGVSSGAGLGAATTMIVGLSVLGSWTMPAAAFLGALATIFVVYAIARGVGGSVGIQTLLLSGVVVGAVLSSILMFMVSQAPSEKLHNVVWWLLGNLQVFDWRLLWIVAGITGVGIAATMLFCRDLNVMMMGEENAMHLGLNVEGAKKMYFLLASLMTGATVAVCGLIGFVGLIVPHSVRLVIGADHRRLVPASALAGAAFLVLADAVARVVIAPIEIPIGVVTALVGGPFFLVLLKRGRRPYRT